MDNNCNIPRFSPTLCLTHNCNLDCIYCYQEHDTGVRMSLDTAKKVIDWIYEHKMLGEDFDNKFPNLADKYKEGV